MRRLPAALVLALLAALTPGHGEAAGSPAGPLQPALRAMVQREPGPYEIFVHGRAGTVDAIGAAASAGALPIATFWRLSAVYTIVSKAQLARLAADPRVGYLEANLPLRPLLDTARKATRAVNVPNSATLRDAQNNPIDGRGVGVAIVDSGVDATHPDLAGRVKKNVKFVSCCRFVELENTDDAGGHGTHVAGIVAGTGAVNGQFTGVAPGATLYAFGAGFGLNVLFATSAMDYIVENFDTFDPPIKVMNNSWGGSGNYDRNSVSAKATKALIAEGVVVVWAAGNESGDGRRDMTTSESKEPTPGAISVANYDDGDSGTRDGDLDDSSSRGRTGRPDTYPDVSAPGASITSTCRVWLPVCATGARLDYPEAYADLGGTSMAAPHVAGIVALVRQYRPNLTPAQIEDLLEDTARKFTAGGAYETDPTNPDNTTSFDKGHGLVDALGALLRLASS